MEEVPKIMKERTVIITLIPKRIHFKRFNCFSGRAKNQQNQNPMPYIQIASKTHTGSFPLA